MKKVLSLFVVVTFFASLANAQITHQFTVTVNTPADMSTMTYNDNYNQEFVIKLDMGALVPGDTIAYRDPFVPQGQVWVRTGFTKSQGDTIMITRNYDASFTPGTGNYCVTAYKFSSGGFAPGFDTTGNFAGTGTFRDCNSLTIVGWPASTNDILLGEHVPSKQKINIFPNPATGNTIGIDYIAQNASELNVNIYDLTGRKVISHSFGKSFKGQEGYQLQIDDLNSGMYILELRQDGIKATGQFIK